MRIEESLELPVPPAALWPWISTPERLGQWITDAQRLEAVPPGNLAPGSRLLVHVARSATPIEVVVERAEPPRVLWLRARGLPDDLSVLLTLDVREQDGGSLLELTAEAELRGLMFFAEKIIASKARARLSAWTQRLRALVSPA